MNRLQFSVIFLTLWILLVTNSAHAQCPESRFEFRAFGQTTLSDTKSNSMTDATDAIDTPARVEFISPRPTTEVASVLAEAELRSSGGAVLFEAVARSLSCVSGQLDTGQASEARSSATIDVRWKPESSTISPDEPFTIVALIPISGVLSAWTGTSHDDQVLSASADVEFRVDGFEECYRKFSTRNDVGQSANPGVLTYVAARGEAPSEVICGDDAPAGFDCELVDLEREEHANGFTFQGYRVSGEISCEFEGQVNRCFSLTLFLTSRAETIEDNDN